MSIFKDIKYVHIYPKFVHSYLFLFPLFILTCLHETKFSLFRMTINAVFLLFLTTKDVIFQRKIWTYITSTTRLSTHLSIFSSHRISHEVKLHNMFLWTGSHTSKFFPVLIQSWCPSRQFENCSSTVCRKKSQQLYASTISHLSLNTQHSHLRQAIRVS